MLDSFCLDPDDKGSVRNAGGTQSWPSGVLLPQVIHLTGRFEIVSLVGTLNPDAHLHTCLSR